MRSSASGAASRRPCSRCGVWTRSAPSRAGSRIISITSSAQYWGARSSWSCRFPPDAQTSGNLEVIRQASERARDLVDQILAFGHRRDPERRPIRIQTLMEETGALLASTMPGRATLRIDEAPAAAIVSGEAAQLQQVVVNLCSNAAQAMDGEGVVKVETAIRMVEKNSAVPARQSSTGPLCVHRCSRYRARHGPEDAGADLRALLHHTP